MDAFREADGHSCRRGWCVGRRGTCPSSTGGPGCPSPGPAHRSATWGPGDVLEGGLDGPLGEASSDLQSSPPAVPSAGREPSWRPPSGLPCRRGGGARRARHVRVRGDPPRGRRDGGRGGPPAVGAGPGGHRGRPPLGAVGRDEAVDGEATGYGCSTRGAPWFGSRLQEISPGHREEV